MVAWWIGVQVTTILGILLVYLAHLQVASGYGIEDTELQCYNCTWTREILNHHVREEMPEPPAELICNDATCKLNNGICVKDITEKDGVVMSVHRFCAISNEESGCYVHDEVDSIVRKVCVCSDWHLCNASSRLKVSSIKLVLVLVFWIINWK